MTSILKDLLALNAETAVDEAKKTKDWTKIKSISSLHEWAMDNLDDDLAEKLDGELQGLHIEDRADHEEARSIIEKFLTKHFKPAVNEARGRGADMHGLLDKWMDQNNAHNWEGTAGIRNLTKLVRALGYSNLDAFFSDNSGALEAIVEFITNANGTEFADALKNEVGEDDEGNDDDR